MKKNKARTKSVSIITGDYRLFEKESGTNAAIEMEIG